MLEAHQLLGFIAAPLQIAEVIKDELWPNPLKYFNSDVSVPEIPRCETLSVQMVRLIALMTKLSVESA